MEIELIKTEEDAMEFAREEFQRRGINWNVYTLLDAVEVTKKDIEKLKLKHSSPGWKLTFTLNNSSGFETKYLFLDISLLNKSVDVVSHY